MQTIQSNAQEKGGHSTNLRENGGKKSCIGNVFGGDGFVYIYTEPFTII